MSQGSGFENIRGRAWAYTLNNYTQEEVDALLAVDCVRHACGKEVGDSGTPHLQGYIRFKQPKKGQWWKKHFPRAHATLKYKESTETQATDYCLKGGDVLINFGVNHDRKVDDGLSRAEEADIVMEEIDKGATWGQVRAKHRQFCFWNRRAVLQWGSDNKQLMLARVSEPWEVLAKDGWTDFRW